MNILKAFYGLWLMFYDVFLSPFGTLYEMLITYHKDRDLK